MLIKLIGEYLKQIQHHEYTIDASGYITHINNETVKIGLENPYDQQYALGIIELIGY